MKVKYDILPSEMRIELHGRIYAGVPDQPLAGLERVVYFMSVSSYTEEEKENEQSSRPVF
ncbi:hypothetical protein [Emergencia timonensis]|uniref:hypothetical protein n=1 Tax=Emergencia timonensis TaxID=1776384 RepID=UPI001A9A2ED9|nr:hypothetical protein [Emergencia timonensis]BDF09242.1 hypothetical protein CE91St48_26830 [Emergencia timonensis]BDF13329.1 hypothetical protein CE91St49_26760 [Emergencia timonensis]